MAVHGISDAVQEWITGQRGMAQTRIAFIRGNAVRVVDSDGEQEQAMPVAGARCRRPGTRTEPDRVQHVWSRLAHRAARPAHGTRARFRCAAQHDECDAGVHARREVDRVRAEHRERCGPVRRPARGRAFPRRITVGRGSMNVQPSFSPDGNRIAFMSDRTGHPEVYIMDADGTNPTSSPRSTSVIRTIGPVPTGRRTADRSRFSRASTDGFRSLR